jgi:serine phosphatase RsbU (regulator of sigma subunit)
MAMVTLLALSPLAYLAGVALIRKYDPNTHIGFEVGRREAIRAAADYAGSRGVNVNGWSSGVQVDADNDRYFYYRLHQSSEINRATRIAPEAVIRVLFISPDGRERMQVSLGKEGRPLGFERTLPSNLEIPDPGETATRALAETAFRNLTQQDASAPLDAPELKEERKFNRVTRSYSWRLSMPTLPELDLRAEISVLGNVVTKEQVTSKFDEAYARDNFINRHIASKLAMIPFALYVMFMAIYGLHRYIQRTRQKEVSHVRSLLVCGLMAVAFMMMSLQTDFLIFNGSQGVEQWSVSLIILLISGTMFLLLGAFLGMAYGSGEGDMREAYPGKLTSLDALITGRVFSRNVGRAICIGAAIGGWTLFARVLILLPWSLRPDMGQGLADRSYTVLFGHLTWAIPLLMPFFAVVSAVIGLLLPLSFLHHRRLRSKKLSLALLALMSLISSALVFQEQPVTFMAGLLTAIIVTASLLVSFFVFDLLTAIINIAAPALFIFIIYFLAQPAASLNRAGYVAGGVALALLALAVFVWYRGREYRDDEVRPLYARNLAHRLGLQAEVSAAREAQTRLMPQELPRLSGLNVAASCLPARVVGGDFYDLFVFDENKLGIFVAEGGGRGLGAALTIAFAKGFMMPRIGAGYSPSDIICSLQTQLAPLLEQDEELAFAYAVVDTSQKTLAYARTGHYPQVITSRNGQQRQQDHINRTREEHELKIPLSAATPDANCIVREATIQLDEGDAITFVTDGVVRSLPADKKISIEEWAHGLFAREARQANRTLQQSLDKALERRARHIKKIGIEDDLTAVVIRFEPSGATR